MFCIMESNITEENMTFDMNEYNLHILPKNRQIASGILVGVKCNLTSTFCIVKEMDTSDKIEITKTEIWKNNEHYKIYSIYNPPNNKPDLTTINIEPKTIIIGDFNAHSQIWGYSTRDGPGKIMEEFINSNTIELVYKSSDIPTFLHYNGSLTNPYLLLVSSDITTNTERYVKEDPGSGHRMIVAKITPTKMKHKTKNTIRSTWNFKKAKWNKYREHLDNNINKISISTYKSPDAMNKDIIKIILEVAKKFIPRGKVPKYKSFWNKKLSNLKNERNKARRVAEMKKTRDAVIDWRRKAAIMKKEVNTAKMMAFNNFIETMDYRKDGPKAYSFIANNYKKKSNEMKPFIHNGKTITDGKKIAAIFNTQYTKKYQIPNKI